MKKLLLSLFALCLAVAVNAKTPEQLATQAVNVENNRVQKSFTEQQKEQVYKIYLDHHKAEYPDEAAKKKALGVANKEAQALLTPEQKEKRAAYFAALKAKREAAKQ